MANVLVVAEQQSGTLKKATLHALGAGSELARRLGGKLYVLVAGKGVGQVAEELRAYAAVLVADAPVLEHYLAESYAPVVADAARAAQADHLCAAATAFGKDLLPRVAARLAAAMATEGLSFGGQGAQVTFRRPMWAGNVLADVELGTPVKAFTIRPTEFPPAAKSAAPRSPAPGHGPGEAGGRPGRGWRGDGSRATGRWARPARWSRPSSTSLPGSPARSSTLPG